MPPSSRRQNFLINDVDHAIKEVMLNSELTDDKKPILNLHIKFLLVLQYNLVN